MRGQSDSMKVFALYTLSALLIGGFILVTPVRAQSILEGVTQTGEQAFERDSQRLPFSDEEYSATAPRSPITVAALMVNILLGLVGIVLVVLIIYAGFQYMFAAGPEAAKKAQKSLVNAGIGLAILLGAYSISYFVLRQVEYAVRGPRTLEVGGTQGQTIELPDEVNLQGGF